MFLWNIAVTSLAEVWIEIQPLRNSNHVIESLPLRKCGLKFPSLMDSLGEIGVTSLAEVWIEIWEELPLFLSGHSHFPCGSVD